MKYFDDEPLIKVIVFVLMAMVLMIRIALNGGH